MTRDTSVDAAPTAERIERELTALFEGHYSRLIRLAALVAHRSVAAEDVVQAAMEQAWRRRATLREPSRARAWLDRIVVREAIRLNRRGWTRRPARAIDPTIELTDLGAEIGPDRVAILQAFRKLPDRQRVVIVLHLQQGYSLTETAALTDAPLETVRTRLRRARETLRRELREVAG
jgi:RNA polymerase sigma-70 factor, ECF subfamily